LELRSKKSLTISWYIGILALSISWFVLSIWAGARYFDARKFEIIDSVWVLWVLICFWFCVFGLILLSVYTFYFVKKLRWNVILCGVVLLANVPSIFTISQLKSNIEDKVFVKIKNNTGLDILILKLQNQTNSLEIGNIETGSSKVFNYETSHWYNKDRTIQKPENLKLIVQSGQVKDTIDFPVLKVGDCKRMILDRNLNLVMK
jgi:hypothetical protein